MNKKIGLFLATLFISVLLVSFVSAAVDFGSMFKSAGTSTVNYLSNLSPESNPLFLKSLFFIIVFLFVHVTLGYIPMIKDKGFMKLLVAVIVTILAVMFAPQVLLTNMLNPYIAMGATFIAIVPFALLFVFTGKVLRNTFLRSTIWFFFAVVLLALSIVTTLKDPTSYISWMYGFVSVFAAAMCLYGDWIDRKIWEGKIAEFEESARRRHEETRAGERIRREKAHAELMD